MLLNSFGDEARTDTCTSHQAAQKIITNATYTFLGGFCCGKNTGFLPDFIVRITSVRGESRPQ